MSLATWESIVHDMPACGGFASKDSGWTSWVLDRPPSVLRLPPTAHEVVRLRRPDYREWALPDSGGVEIWITDDPAMGMVATRPWKIKLEAQCNHAVAGHPGVVIQYSAVKEGQADTSYGATVHTVIARGLSFNAFLRASTKEERAALVSAVARLELRR